MSGISISEWTTCMKVLSTPSRLKHKHDKRITCLKFHYNHEFAINIYLKYTQITSYHKCLRVIRDKQLT